MSAELSSADHCGVIATSGTDIDPADFGAGWWRLRHRGDFSWGLVTAGLDDWISGHVQKSDAVKEPIMALANISADSAIRIGHNRYITSGGSSIENAQPFLLTSDKYTLALAHNGNIPTEVVDRLRLYLRYKPEETASDSRVIAQLLLEQRDKHESWDDTFLTVLPHLAGAFSLVVVTDDKKLFAMRDPWGIRPLCIGKKDNTWVVASESVALDTMGATFVREVNPGEMVVFDPEGTVTVTQYGEAENKALCLVEMVYFSKVASKIDEETYLDKHQALGRAVGRRFLAKGIEVDHVIPILNSGKQMSIGVAEVLGMPQIVPITLSTDERSFIQNTPAARRAMVNKKHVIDGSYIAGQRILLCDDSLVRGTSLLALLENIKAHEPKEIHIVLGSEPLIDFCDLGVDLPRPEDLLAYRQIQDRPDWNENYDVMEWLARMEMAVAKYLDVDSVTYLDRAGVNEALGKQDDEMCRHCFGGTHPVRDHKRPHYIKDVPLERAV